MSSLVASGPARPRSAQPAASVRARGALVGALCGLACAVAACSPDASTGGPFLPGTAEHPREVIIAARDYSYVPPVVDLVPGETVRFEVVNGGLVTHEVVVGTLDVQDAWEAAEAAPPPAPPGRTPEVSVPPDTGGLRFVLVSGQRVDVTWTVPLDASARQAAWYLGCHIPGHWAEGMVAPVRFIDASGQPVASVPPIPSGAGTP